MSSNPANRAPAKPVMADIPKLTTGWWDPLLAQISGPGKFAGYLEGGFKVLPTSGVRGDARRVVLLGNSTSMWPDYPFAIAAHQALTGKGHAFQFLNGSAKSHTSAQELLRVVRDVPPLAPDLVFALSGICDLGSICLANSSFPFQPRYGQSVSAAVRKTGIAPKGISLGVPDPATVAERWCRHHRQARVLCEDLGITYRVALQPVMGYGQYSLSKAENRLLQSKAGVTLQSNGKTYLSSVTEFYDGVRDILQADPDRHSHVLDWTDLFAETPEAYLDHRHPSAAGCDRLATELTRLVATSFGLTV